MDTHARVGRDGGQGVREPLEAAAEHVRHHRPGRPGRGVTERQVEDRTQVLLELTRDGAVDRVVAGVVRAQRELVDDQAPAGQDEELHGEQPLDVEVDSDRAGDCAGLGENRRRQ